MTKIHTHYDTLSVVRNAPPEVIRAAYKILSQKYHPDRNSKDANETAIMAKINEAYAVLSDPEKRKKYDKWLAEQEASATQQDERARRPEPEKKTNQTKPPPPPKSESSSIGKWFLYGFIAFVVWLVFKMPNTDSVQKEVTPPAAVAVATKPNLSELETYLAGQGYHYYRSNIGTCVAGDCINGQGTYTFPDGDKYVGEFKIGLREGQGTYTYPDGNKYVGEWKNDIKEGQGTMIYPNGTKYIGEWKNDIKK